jgi:dihydrofolate reductase
MSSDNSISQRELDSLRRAGAHLVGRVTYQQMAAAWPGSTSEYAPPMNDIPKVVFSKTLQTRRLDRVGDRAR